MSRSCVIIPHFGSDTICNTQAEAEEKALLAELQQLQAERALLHQEQLQLDAESKQLAEYEAQYV